MKEKQMKVYVETRPFVKVEKQLMFDCYFKRSIKTPEGFNEFQRVAYAIRLMSKGIKKSAFKTMFIKNPESLNIASSFAKAPEQELSR